MKSRIAEPVSSGNSQGRAVLADCCKIENLSFLLKSVEALAVPDFHVICLFARGDGMTEPIFKSPKLVPCMQNGSAARMV